jgi:predicted nucleic acid-binding protein
MRNLVDTNILLRWVKPDDRDYGVVRTAMINLVKQGVNLCYTSRNLAEFWNTWTRPANRNGYGLSIPETDLRAGLIENSLSLLADDAAVHRQWREIVVPYSVSGIQVHDARLVASMRVHGVKRILTFNQRDFARYKDIDAVDPRYSLPAVLPSA